jgi:hypothetical protein
LAYQPHEILENIASNLDPKSMAQLSRVTKRLHTTMKPILAGEKERKFLAQKHIEDFKVEDIVDEDEPDSIPTYEGYDGFSNWILDALNGRKTKPANDSIYLWNITKPIKVLLPDEETFVTFQGLTTVQQFADKINQALEKIVKKEQLDSIDDILMDLRFYEGLTKDSEGVYSLDLGS